MNFSSATWLPPRSPPGCRCARSSGVGCDMSLAVTGKLLDEARMKLIQEQRKYDRDLDRIRLLEDKIKRLTRNMHRELWDIEKEVWQ